MESFSSLVETFLSVIKSIINNKYYYQLEIFGFQMCLYIIYFWLY